MFGARNQEEVLSSHLQPQFPLEYAQTLLVAMLFLLSTKSPWKSGVQFRSHLRLTNFLLVCFTKFIQTLQNMNLDLLPKAFPSYSYFFWLCSAVYRWLGDRFCLVLQIVDLVRSSQLKANILVKDENNLWPSNKLIATCKKTFREILFLN